MRVATFSVLTEPWIPVRQSDGRLVELGILDCLARAHEMRSVSDPAPPVELGLYRLLIAFVMDAWSLHDIDGLESLFEARQFSRAALEKYVDGVDRSRFDLFDPEHPFLQTAAVGAGAKRKSVAELFPHLPTGTFAVHFNHLKPNEQGFCPAVCARGLAMVAPFTTAGGAGFSPSVNGSPPWYVLVRGDSLFETLLLNCYALAGDYPVDSLPAWRALDGTPIRGERTAHSYVQALTWQPRAILLHPEKGGRCTYSGRESDCLVRQMVFDPGLKAIGDWTDPQVAYRHSTQGRTPVRPREDREVWRDTGPLLLLRAGTFCGSDGKTSFTRPFVVDQLRVLAQDGVVAKPLTTIDVYGMRTDLKMKVFEWQHETLALPAKVTASNLAGVQLQAGIDQAERVSDYLGKAIKVAYPRRGEGNAKALAGLIRSARELLWNRLEGQFQLVMVEGVASQDPDDPAAPAALIAKWKEVLKREGGKALDRALGPLDTDAAALARQVAARDLFWKFAFADPSTGPAAGKRRQAAKVKAGAQSA